MIVASNTNDQTLTPGQTITFDNVILHTGCAERRRNNSIRLRSKGVYDVEFSGNIAGATGDQLALAISVGGEVQAATTAEARGAGTTLFSNVSTGTYVFNECCEVVGAVTIQNVGTTNVVVQAGSNIRVKRVG